MCHLLAGIYRYPRFEIPTLYSHLKLQSCLAAGNHLPNHSNKRINFKNANAPKDAQLVRNAQDLSASPTASQNQLPRPHFSTLSSTSYQVSNTHKPLHRKATPTSDFVLRINPHEEEQALNTPRENKGPTPEKHLHIVQIQLPREQGSRVGCQEGTS